MSATPVPGGDLTRFKPLADTVMLELWLGTPTLEITRICSAGSTDHLVGFLSRAGFNGIATDLYVAAQKEMTT